MSLSQCWILSDGTAGMENQAVGLAEAMRLDYAVQRIRPSRLLRLFPACGRLPGMPPAAVDNDRFQPPYPVLLITCGRRHAGASIALRRRSGQSTFTVHIQDPRTKPEFFDILVVPEHDRARGPNVITTIGSLNKISAGVLAAEACRFSSVVATLPRPLVAVNIGGGTRQRAIDMQEAEDIVKSLKQLLDSQECSLLITTSRRTDTSLLNKLDGLGQRLDTILWRGGENNPYLGFLGLSDFIVVTSDSINMISEACTTGKPVYVLPMGPETRRRTAFLDSVFRRGIAHRFDGRLEANSGSTLGETDRIAELVLSRFAEKRMLEPTPK